jgi:hypothetical protein
MKTRIIQDGPEPADLEPQRPTDLPDEHPAGGADEDGADAGAADRPRTPDSDSKGGTP